MTWNEAKNTLELNRPFAYSELKEAVDMAIKAIEKQIPKKPNIDAYCGFTSYICPVCRHEVEVSDYYCRCCGQKIRKTTNN